MRVNNLYRITIGMTYLQSEKDGNETRAQMETNAVSGEYQDLSTVFPYSKSEQKRS